MKSIVNPIAQQALQRALQAARMAPKPRQKTDSRTADKFVVRGYAELFTELVGIGRHQGRSANSEMVAAALEALDGFKRSNKLLQIQRAYLGDDLAKRVLEEVPDFDIKVCKEDRNFVIRFPAEVRDTVREGVKNVDPDALGTREQSMNEWLLGALVTWVKIQRQHYALLSAAIALDNDLLGSDRTA